MDLHTTRKLNDNVTLQLPKYLQTAVLQCNNSPQDWFRWLQTCRRNRTIALLWPVRERLLYDLGYHVIGVEPPTKTYRYCAGPV